MKNIFLFLISGLAMFQALGQSIRGTVYESHEGKNRPLPGVNVYWPGSQIGTVTGADGSFSINPPNVLPAKLVFSYVGFHPDTITVTNISKEIKVVLKASIDLNAFEVVGRQAGTNISMVAPINAETLTVNELKKAACCNLAESFETNASVDVNYTDAVSGARQIQMLGLDGVYSQITTEGSPSVRGLASSYGLAFIPGTWIESIQISKGPGSVVNGYESITGHINVELQKPENAEKLYLNGYANHFGRYEANLHYGEKVSEKWSTLTFAHASAVTRKLDMNGDGFLNNPLQKQFNLFNRWKYSGKGPFQAQFGVKALVDDRVGGQLSFNPKSDYNTKNSYGITINSRQLETFSKTSLSAKNHPYRSIGLISSFKHYQQDALYGIRNYSGEQNTGHFNLVYQDFIKTSDHKIKAGASFITDNYSERFIDSTFSRNETVPGLFTEYHHEIEGKYSVLLGFRGDYHNMFGFIPTPRAHFKLNLLPKTVARASLGRGFRVANVFAENTAIMATSRSIYVSRDLAPEVAWTYGGGITHNLCLGERGAVFNLDFYRTDFTNQVVVDYDRSLREIHFYNLEGQSYSNSFQAEVVVEASKRLEFKTAYKWYDVRSTYHGELLQRPLVSNNRMLFNTTYFTRFEKWKFDFTAKWYGQTRIPGGHGTQSPGQVHLPTHSPAFWSLLGQVTRSFKSFDIYLGGENLGNFMQHNPIISPEDPFGPNFDASLVWGPLMGRTFYTGFRFKIK